MIERLWWAPGIQPGSTHHRSSKPCSAMTLPFLLKKDPEGLFWSNDNPAGTTPVTKYFQAHAQSWQDSNFACSDGLSLSPPLPCAQAQQKPNFPGGACLGSRL